MKKFWAGCLLAAMVVGLSACSGPGGTSTEASSAAPEDASTSAVSETSKAADQTAGESVINVAITAAPPNLDPPTSSSNLALTIAMHFMEPLFAIDAQYQPQPMLAESYEVNDDCTAYTIKLRSGIKFHDGKDLLAEDVVASMNYWLKTSERAKNILGTGVFSEVDASTVKVVFDQPAKDFITLAASRANFPAIRTKEAIEGAGEEGITKDFNGTGPYKFVEWKPDQYIHLTKNDAYQPRSEEASGYAGKKEALIKDIYYHIVPDAATRMAGLIAGTYDATDEITADNYKELKDNQDLSITTDVGGTLTLFLNTKEGPLKNFGMRNAMIKAINTEDIMLSSFVEKDLYTMGPEYMNPNMPQWKSEQGKDQYNQANPEEAKKALEAAGYKGETIHILTTPDYAEMYNASIVLGEQLKKAGMTVEINEFDFPTFMETKGDLKKWDLFITSNGYQVLPQQLLIVNPEWAGADDPKLADMVKSVKTAKTQEDATKAWDQTQGYLYNEYLSSYALGQYNNAFAISKKVKNFNMFESLLIWNLSIEK